ncbi:hypothetical protein B484DRAFT_291861 [Ochromonadaceae sp. CCMP2298]|nr:hypothetical protein B484DRAFT_291861 [Ochromonadaceae sp. CCMP2298]
MLSPKLMPAEMPKFDSVRERYLKKLSESRAPSNSPSNSLDDMQLGLIKQGINELDLAPMAANSSRGGRLSSGEGRDSRESGENREGGESSEDRGGREYAHQPELPIVGDARGGEEGATGRPSFRKDFTPLGQSNRGGRDRDRDAGRDGGDRQIDRGSGRQVALLARQLHNLHQSIPPHTKAPAPPADAQRHAHAQAHLMRNQQGHGHGHRRGWGDAGESGDGTDAYGAVDLEEAEARETAGAGESAREAAMQQSMRLRHGPAPLVPGESIACMIRQSVQDLKRAAQQLNNDNNNQQHDKEQQHNNKEQHHQQHNNKGEQREQQDQEQRYQKEDQYHHHHNHHQQQQQQQRTQSLLQAIAGFNQHLAPGNNDGNAFITGSVRRGNSGGDGGERDPITKADWGAVECALGEGDMSALLRAHVALLHTLLHRDAVGEGEGEGADKGMDRGGDRETSTGRGTHRDRGDGHRDRDRDRGRHRDRENGASPRRRARSYSAGRGRSEREGKTEAEGKDEGSVGQGHMGFNIGDSGNLRPIHRQDELDALLGFLRDQAEAWRDLGAAEAAKVGAAGEGGEGGEGGTSLGTHRAGTERAGTRTESLSNCAQVTRALGSTAALLLVREVRLGEAEMLHLNRRVQCRDDAVYSLEGQLASLQRRNRDLCLDLAEAQVGTAEAQEVSRECRLAAQRVPSLEREIVALRDAREREEAMTLRLGREHVVLSQQLQQACEESRRLREREREQGDREQRERELREQREQREQRDLWEQRERFAEMREQRETREGRGSVLSDSDSDAEHEATRSRTSRGSRGSWGSGGSGEQSQSRLEAERRLKRSNEEQELGQGQGQGQARGRLGEHRPLRAASHVGWLAGLAVSDWVDLSDEAEQGQGQGLGMGMGQAVGQGQGGSPGRGGPRLLADVQAELEAVVSRVRAARGELQVRAARDAREAREERDRMRESERVREREEDERVRERERDSERDRGEAALCCICKEAEKCILLLPCRHLCVCRDCFQGVPGWSPVVEGNPSLQSCPVCRAAIADVLHVYS